MKKIISTLLIIVGFFCMSGYFYLAPYHEDIVRVGDHYFFVEVVDTPEQWQKGLSGRESMCGRCGMVFDFGEASQHSFWMKDMRFDIDILWVRDGEIVGIEGQVSHTSPLKQYASNMSVDMVVELSAGTAQKYSITVGDTLDF